MTHPKKIFLLFFAFTVVASGLALLASSGEANPLHATAQLGNILPDCDPSKLPSEVGACGVSKFLQLIANIIKFLVNLTLIIAPILIVVGGIAILTAGGSAERISKGKSIIVAAVVGIVIALSSYLIVKLVFLALGANVPNQGSFLP